jgi:hypothetical protein
MTEFEIVSALDQSLEVDGSEEEILKRVEELITQAIINKDVIAALNVPKQIIMVQKVAGLGLAKSIYMIKQNWEVFELDESFDEYAMDWFGTHKATIVRYERVWRTLHSEQAEDIPEKFKEKLQSLNLSSQVVVANIIEQGYELEEDEWKELSEQPDYHSINRTAREIKGKEPRAQSLQIWIEEDGTIKCSKGGATYYVGWLDAANDNVIVQQAIERIKKHTGVMEI